MDKNVFKITVCANSYEGAREKVDTYLGAKCGRATGYVYEMIRIDRNLNGTVVCEFKCTTIKLKSHGKKADKSTKRSIE